MEGQWTVFVPVKPQNKLNQKSETVMKCSCRSPVMKMRMSVDKINLCLLNQVCNDKINIIS